MKKPMIIAVCLLVGLCLTAKKTDKYNALYVGQSMTIEGLTITLASNGLHVRSENDSVDFTANFSYEKCYAINPGIAIHTCEYGSILFKDTSSRKVVLRLELPGGKIEKILLYPKQSPPQVMLDGGQLRGVFRAAFFIVFCQH